MVLHGPEHFLHAERTAELREALEAAHGAVDVLQFDGKTAEPATVLDECRSLGLIAAHKLVIVDDADQFVKETSRAMVERYAQHPEPGATLLLRTAIWRKGKLDGLIEAVGVLKPCDYIDRDRLAIWARARASKRYLAEVSREIAEVLVARVGESMGRVDTELQKLALAARSATNPPIPQEEPVTITEELVNQMVPLSREESAWAIQETLLSGDPELGIRQARELIEVSREPAVLVTFAMTDLARKTHAAAHALRAGGNPFALAGKLKIWGPSKDAVLDAARRIDPAKLHRLLATCIDTDRRQKSGYGDPARSVERLIVQFADVFGPGPRSPRGA